MRLSERNPVYRQVWTYDKDGQPLAATPLYELSFDCPRCGPPHRAVIKVGTEAANEKVPRWHAASLPTAASWTDDLTVEPSIWLAHQAHGLRGPDCHAHFSIIAGEIIL